MTRMDRRALFASGAAAALLAATGATAAPQRGGRLRAALSEELFDRTVAATVYENLTEIAADGTLRGELATGWTSDAQGRHWQFNLRDDVKFHDGTGFDATATLSLPYAIDLRGTHQIEIFLDAPDPNLPYRLAQPGFELRAPSGAGTGLYRVHKLDAGRHFVGVRVDTHWRTDGGWFDSLDFVRIPSEVVRAEALRDGLVDVADITALDASMDAREFLVLPGGQDATHVASRAVTVPLTVGKAWPLDNLRMAERWWMA